MGGMTHKELGLPHQLLNKKMHYNLPTVDLMETFFSAEVPLPR